MRKVYTCNICGYSSEFKKNVTECEKRGKPNLYDYGWTVSFMKDHQKRSGVIVRVSFTQQKHKPVHGVQINGTEITVLEENILDGTPPPPSAA